MNLPKELELSMKQCDHSYDGENLNPYHLEGDVLEHTRLVHKLCEENSVLKEVAKYHDIGKIETRNENHEKKRVSFYGHAGVSAWKSLQYTKDLTPTKREMVFKLITAHMDYHILPVKKMIKRYGKETNLFKQQFLDFGMADDMGRIGDGEFDFVGNWEILVESFFDATSAEAPRDTSKLSKELTVLVGLPCSGKSTYVENNDCGAVLSRDAIIEEMGDGDTYREKWTSVNQKKVDKALFYEKRELISDAKKVTIDMTNMSRKGRRKNMIGFGKTWKKKAIVFLTDLEEIYERNEARTGKTIPKDVYLRMMKSFSMPSYEEFDVIEWRLG